MSVFGQEALQGISVEAQRFKGPAVSAVTNHTSLLTLDRGNASTGEQMYTITITPVDFLWQRIKLENWEPNVETLLW